MTRPTEIQDLIARITSFSSSTLIDNLADIITVFTCLLDYILKQRTCKNKILIKYFLINAICNKKTTYKELSENNSTL